MKHRHRTVGRNASDEVFRAKLSRTEKCQRRGCGGQYPRRRGNGGVVVKFSDGSVLKANYWRLIQDGRALLSSFDHQKKYGLPAPIDAKEQISSLLEGKICDDVQFDRETADLWSSVKPQSCKSSVSLRTKFGKSNFLMALGNTPITLLHELPIRSASGPTQTSSNVSPRVGCSG